MLFAHLHGCVHTHRMKAVRGSVSSVGGQGQEQPTLCRGTGDRAIRKRRGKAFQAQAFQGIAGAEARRRELTCRMWGKDRTRQLDLARTGSYLE